MHEKRNFILFILFVAGFFWSGWSWIFADMNGTGLMRAISTSFAVLIGAWLGHALFIEDKLPDVLEEIVGSHYFDADGVCVLPVIRSNEYGPELSIYYQNRFENPASVIVHLQPTGESFVVVPGATDVHIAFIVGGGDVGVIHQPITVPRKLQGDIVELKMVAVSYYSRSHGSKLRSNEGHPCGSMFIDWAGNAMRVGPRQVDGSVELKQPVTLHLAMPKGCPENQNADRTWRQELISVT
jgi:hypothetical protein